MISNLRRRENPVVESNFIDSAFDAFHVLSTTPDDNVGGFEGRRSDLDVRIGMTVQVNCHSLRVAYQHYMIPGFFFNAGLPDRVGLREIARTENESARFCRRA